MLVRGNRALKVLFKKKCPPDKENTGGDQGGGVNTFKKYFLFWIHYCFHTIFTQGINRARSVFFFLVNIIQPEKLSKLT